MVDENRFRIRLEILKRHQPLVFAKLVEMSRGQTVKMPAEARIGLIEAAILSDGGTLPARMGRLVLELDGDGQ